MKFIRGCVDKSCTIAYCPAVACGRLYQTLLSEAVKTNKPSDMTKVCHTPLRPSALYTYSFTVCLKQTTKSVDGGAKNVTLAESANNSPSFAFASDRPNSLRCASIAADEA